MVHGLSISPSCIDVPHGPRTQNTQNWPKILCSVELRDCTSWTSGPGTRCAALVVMRLFSTSLILSALVFAGCASDVDVGGNTDGDLSDGGNWDISDVAHQKMMTFSLPYDGPSAKCSGGFTEGANQLARMVRSRFPNAVAQTLGYACRANTADPSSLSIHGMGRAVDVMMKSPAGKGGDDEGKEIADFFLLNGDLLGVQYIIWNQTKCNLHLKSCGRYTGPNPHTDHIHVEITLEAASLKAPFYSGTPLRDGTTSADPADPVDPSNPDPADPNNPDPDPNPTNPSGGRECSADLDCGDSGMCSTVPQQGRYYCCESSSTPGCQ